ncbi:hypothetical protein CerSpe_215120 [Prunus speciosa]
MTITQHTPQDFTEYTNLEECITYLCDYITSKGPFDGLLGFSQILQFYRHLPTQVLLRSGDHLICEAFIGVMF